MGKNKKSVFLSVLIVIVFLFLLFIVLGNINLFTTKKTYIKNDLIETGNNTTTLTQLIMQVSRLNEKGPKPKPDKIAYITIDDGPSKFTDGILSILDSNNVKATFFMIEGNMRQYPEQLKRMKNEGHSMGFHSVTHDVKKLYKSTESAVDEFEKCKSTLYKITNVNSNLMRIPYGSKPYTPEETYNSLVSKGFKIWDWNLDTEDWKSTTEEILNNVNKYVGNNDEIVLLMHEKEQSVRALQGIIDILKSKGYTIIPISENDEPKNFWKQNLRE